MPPQQRIQPQNPELSPTYSHSQAATQNNASIPPSIRRNLFAGHLSRRPIPSEVKNNSVPSSSIPDPFQSQSPMRQNAPEPDIFQSQPSLQPTTSRAGSVGVHDAFDPSISPTRSLSPSHDARYFPSSSIVAVSPQTGRLLLPLMPTLPPRLRLSEGDDDDEEDDGEEGAHPQDEEHHQGSPTAAAYRHNAGDYTSHYRSDHDMEYDSSSLLLGVRPSAEYGGGLHASFVDPSVGAGDSRDLERIEQLLSKMQAQQREKAIDTYSSSAATMHAPAAASSSTAAAAGPSASSSKISTRSTARGKARATARSNQQHHNMETLYSSTGAERKQGPLLGGVGATIDPAEKDEMLGLIMTSLRRKVQQANDEAWMYDGSGGGGGGYDDGIGAGGGASYHDEIGLYE